MKNKNQIFMGVLLAVSLAVLILNSQASLQGAREGITLCLTVVIPSLYPFIFLSTMLPSRLIGTRIRSLGGLCRLCGIPDGAESLLLLSFLGGYPIGAKIVYDSYKQGSISKSAACRMLGFCNNAGPAFLFGMVGGLFTDRRIVWVLWLIHILSALLVGILLPGKSEETCILSQTRPLTVPQALENSIKAMGNICGWVVIFRVILTILDQWFLWLLHQDIYAGIFGLFELSNGISCLREVANHATRFILCSGMLAFGGLCVFMQTASVTKELGLGRYFPGKVLHCLFSILLSLIFVQIFSI